MGAEIFKDNKAAIIISTVKSRAVGKSARNRTQELYPSPIADKPSDIPGVRVGRVIIVDVDLLDDEARGQVARQIAAPQDHIPSAFSREACHVAQANLAAIRLREHALSSGENGRKYVVIV